MFHNTNRTKYNKKFKIQTRQNTKEQNTNCQNTIVTKYKCNKIQMEQNTNRTECKNTKIQPPYSRPPPLTHWFSIGTPSICILSCLYFGILYFVLFVFCPICILLHLYFVTNVFWQFVFCSFVFCRVCILNFLLYFVLFVLWNICILTDYLWLHLKYQTLKRESWT